MKISVCMTSYNGEKYIARQIESILSQLLPDDELVISDDSSTDGTLAIIGSYLPDSRIKLSLDNVFYNPTRNMENALNMATGDIVVLSDHDDCWLPGRITMIRRELTAPGIRLIVMNGFVCDKDLVPMSRDIFQQLNSGPGVLKNFLGNTAPGCCMAFTRDLLKIALPFPRNIPMYDVWLGLLAELYGKVKFVRMPTILYRRHEGTYTQIRGRINYWRAIKNRWHLLTSLTGKMIVQEDGRITAVLTLFIFAMIVLFLFLTISAEDINRVLP